MQTTLEHYRTLTDLLPADWQQKHYATGDVSKMQDISFTSISLSDFFRKYSLS